MNIITKLTPLFILALPACSDVEKDGSGGHHHDHEVISTVVLNLTSQADGTEQEIRWVEGEGQDKDVVLTNATAYDLSISALNELETPIEDITPEIADEADEHQLFFTGSAIDDGLITHTYEDSDGEGLPLGLENTVDAVAAGVGELTVTLRHLALQNGNQVKREGMAEDVAAEGCSGTSGEGDNDFSIPFVIEVQ